MTTPAPTPRPTRSARSMPGTARTLWVTLRHEGQNHLRDRRSTFGALLFPLLGPAILVAGIRFGITTERDVSNPVLVFGADHAPALIEALEGRGVAVVHESGKRADAELAITSGKCRVALVIADDYSQRLREGKVADLEVVLDSSRPKTLGLARRVEGAISESVQTLGALRLLARGVSPAVAHPVRLHDIDLATPEQASAKLLYVIPMMLMLSAFAGGMNIAIDTTAGERERKSLESLLLTPASRFGLLLGKWLTATLAASAVTAVGASLVAVIPPFLALEELGLRMNFSWLSAGWTLLWLMPLASFGVALEMLVASFARTFKEAQTYLSLFLLVPTLPSLLLVYNPLSSTWWTALVPALGQVTAVLDLLEGEPTRPMHLGLAWVASLIYTTAALLLLERLMRNERIVFGR